MRFYRAEPTARTSWRLAVLMGANTRTYKFALAQSLLNAASEGREELTIRELAEPYAMELARRTQHYPQASSTQKLSESDFLSIASQEAVKTLADGHPTEKLLDAAEASIPGMVMQKFHNLREARPDGGLAHRFYEVRGTGRSRKIELTPALREVAADAKGLEHELDARWAIVETSFDSHIGRSLIDGGVVLSSDGQTLLAPTRRAPVTAARYALQGFQHGRCLYCHQPLSVGAREVHVDHVYPYRLMKSGSWNGPDLNCVWNLVVTCAPCNLVKSGQLPSVIEVQALIDRNEAIMTSPHPLKRSLSLAMTLQRGTPAVTPVQRLAFLQRLDLMVTEGGRARTF